MERWQREASRRGELLADDVPAVLAREGAHGPVVHAANRAAALLGIVPGGRLADMRALCPALRVEPADLEGDAAALARLAFWARRWGPWTVADGADGLVIDATGTAHLFGGEAAMLADIEGRLAVAGLTARVAIAPTRGAAWGLARFGGERAVCTDAAQLDGLPAAALRLSPETLLLLRRLGLARIGDLAAVPRLALARRFARAALEDNPLLRLDQLTGRLPEPLDAPDPPPVFEAVVRLAEPVMDPADWLAGLMADLCTQLERADRGCRRLRLSVFRVDGERRDVEIGTAAPSREAGHLLRLFDGRLDRLDPGYGFDQIALQALAVEGLDAARPRLDGGRDEALELARLVDRLIARFGQGAVVRPVPFESHVPERAQIAAAQPAALPAGGRAASGALPPDPRDICASKKPLPPGQAGEGSVPGAREGGQGIRPGPQTRDGSAGVKAMPPSREGEDGLQLAAVSGEGSVPGAREAEGGVPGTRGTGQGIRLAAKARSVPAGATLARPAGGSEGGPQVAVGPGDSGAGQASQRPFDPVPVSAEAPAGRAAIRAAHRRLLIAAAGGAAPTAPGLSRHPAALSPPTVPRRPASPAAPQAAPRPQVRP